MSVETKIETVEIAKKTRRAFVTTAAQVAVTAPAVGLLLSASTKSASAQTRYTLVDDVQCIDCSTGTVDNFFTNGVADDITSLGDDGIGHG